MQRIKQVLLQWILVEFQLRLANVNAWFKTTSILCPK
jgi:hypothetical protein